MKRNSDFAYRDRSQPTRLGWRTGATVFVSIWALIHGLVVVMTSVSGAPVSPDGLMRTLAEFCVSIAMSVPVFAVVDGYHPPSRLRRVGLILLVIIFSSFFANLSFFYFAFHLFPDSIPPKELARTLSNPQFPYNLLLAGTIQLAVFHGVWVAVALSIRVLRDRQRWKLEEANLISEAREAKLSALLYQLNPHFLFNVLNSLSSLVIGGSNDRAELMISKLSRFLRLTLTSDPVKDTILVEEIATQSLYLDIEKLRFPDRISVDIDIPSALENARVPALILQPLVENAVRHAVAISREPVRLSISAHKQDDRLILSVENDGAKAATHTSRAGTGTGHANISARLVARYSGAASFRHHPLECGGYMARLELPLDCDPA